jgi:hypothetical protein
MMPDELARELDQLDVLAIQLADDPGTPVVCELGEFLAKINFFHRERLWRSPP